MWIFRLVRIQNLLIVVLSQVLIQYKVIVPSLNAMGLSPTLSHLQFAMLVLATICVAAAGNVINDIFDIEIDKINRPKSQIVSKIISVQMAYAIYFALIGVGLVLSLIIAFETHRVGLIFLFPLAIVLLHLYSKNLKSKGLIGNIVVSLFVSFVTGLLLLSEYDNLITYNPMISGISVFNLLIGYIGFSFFTNLVRELLKDMEDVTGDEYLGCETYPIKYGIDSAKKLVSFLLLLLIISVGSWCVFYTAMLFENPWNYEILITIPIFIYILAQLKQSNTSKNYHHLSTMVKINMLLGLAYLMVL